MWRLSLLIIKVEDFTDDALLCIYFCLVVFSSRGDAFMDIALLARIHVTEISSQVFDRSTTYLYAFLTPNK